MISGARGNCEVFIEVDMAAAMSEGVRFYVSDNRVVLTSGKFGFLAPKYFRRVWVDRVESLFQPKSISLDYLLVLDFEANCSKTGKLACQEIIEFPVLAVNLATKRVEFRFHTYVRPVVVPEITPFCTELTGITQEMVANAPDLPTVLHLFDDFMREKRLIDRKIAFATCGDWDLKTCLPMECKYKELEVREYFKVWVNVKMMFPVKAMGMMEMIEMMKLQHQGRHHSGIDDAENIANVLISLLEAGVLLQASDIHSTLGKPGTLPPGFLVS